MHKKKQSTQLIPASHRNRSPKRVERGRALRQSATEAETRAWFLLRKLRLKGFKFRRQHFIGNYVVDFCCAERRLVIELDGSIHSQPSQALRDQTGDEYLMQRGYTVARFPNGMVLEAPKIFMEKVLGRIFPLPNVFTGER
ncbi:MAG TPA: endonuclease domain-containing protein [Terriglobia bacterium]|nr:endonuclease domain-containing protein [Terriglobia bacterium]